MAVPPQCVSCSWLKNNLNVKIVDGTWHKPMWNRDSQAEYVSQHIDGAVKFDVDLISDQSASLPLTLPSLELFEKHMGKLGIKNTDHVVIYDNNDKFGMYSAARVWFMFKLFGHEKVSILNGGLPKWLAEGGPVVSGPQPNVEAVTYEGNYCKDLHRTFEEILEIYETNPSLILDARSEGRYEGRDPEPDPSIPSGHIIGSKHLYWYNFIDANTKMMKTVDEIAKVFTDAGVNLKDHYVASCGGGITACWITFAASLCDKNIHVPVYTGSWLDWYKRGPEYSKIIGIKGEDMKKH